MSNTEVFLMLSLLGNIGLIMTMLILLQMYLHARQWRDEWRDAHVDALNTWVSVMKNTKGEQDA